MRIGGLASELFKFGVKFQEMPSGENESEQGSQTNNEDNVDEFENFWQLDKDNTDQSTASNFQSQSQNQNGQDPSRDRFREHLDTLDFMKNVDMDKLRQDFENGSAENLPTAMKTVAENAYTQALIDSSKVMDQKVEKAVEQAVQKSRNEIGSHQMKEFMEEQLSFTKDPAIGPIARGVMQQALQKNGGDKWKALETVKNFFERASKVTSKDLGFEQVPRGRPRNNSGNNPGPSRGQRTDDDEMDWLKILSE